jgi:hypothetical protein
LGANKSANPLGYTFGLIVKNSAGSATSTNVVVSEGAAPPPISFTTPTGSRSTLAFPDEGVFVADDPEIVTVHNNSSVTQVITSVAIGTVGDQTDFILNRNNCSYITAHATCSLAVQFQPSGAGTRTGVVNILDSSWGTAGTIAPLKLRGTGVWATATVSNADISDNTLTFPVEYGVGTPSPVEYVTLLNVGFVPLYVDGISDTGSNSADFAISSDNCQMQVPQIVSVGQKCTFGVSFIPSGSGARTTNIVVDDNTLGTQTQLKVKASAGYSTTTLAIGDNSGEPSPISYDFGSATVGVPTTAKLTITNTSNVTLIFGNASATGIDPSDFAVGATDVCATQGVELAAGQSCSVDLAFNPLTKGTRTATLHIGDNTANGSESIDVSGTGVGTT